MAGDRITSSSSFNPTPPPVPSCPQNQHTYPPCAHSAGSLSLNSLSLLQGIQNTRSCALAFDTRVTKARTGEEEGEYRKHLKHPSEMLLVGLPDLPLEIWEYILHFLPELSVQDIKLVSTSPDFTFRRVNLKEKLRMHIPVGKPPAPTVGRQFRIAPIPFGAVPGRVRR